jgi:hypothetical protein
MNVESPQRTSLVVLSRSEFLIACVNFQRGVLIGNLPAKFVAPYRIRVFGLDGKLGARQMRPARAALYVPG